MRSGRTFKKTRKEFGRAVQNRRRNSHPLHAGQSIIWGNAEHTLLGKKMLAEYEGFLSKLSKPIELKGDISEAIKE